MKNKRKLNKPKEVNAHVIGTAAVMLGGSLLSGAVGLLGQSRQQKMQEEAIRNQRVTALDNMANQNAINNRQLYNMSAQASYGNLQGVNSALQQNYYQNNLTGIPSFAIGGMTGDNLIAVSKGESVDVVENDGSKKARRVKGKGTKFSDSILADASNIESVSSNLLNPFTGNSFSSDNMDLDKFFGRSFSDRDWISQHTKDMKQSKKEQIKSAVMGVQNRVGEFIPSKKTKTMPSGTPIQAFNKGGYINRPTEVPAALTGLEWAQLGSAASSFIPAIYNLTANQPKPTRVNPMKVEASHNLYEGSVMALMNQNSFPIQQYIDQVNRGVATSNYNARDVGNTGAYRALRLSNDIASIGQLANIYSAKAQHDAQQRAAAGQILSQMGDRRAQIDNAINQMNQQSIYETNRENAINLDNYLANMQQMRSAGWSQLAGGINNLGNSTANILNNRDMKGILSAYMGSAGYENKPGFFGESNWVKKSYAPAGNQMAASYPNLLGRRGAPLSFSPYQNLITPAFSSNNPWWNNAF